MTPKGKSWNDARRYCLDQGGDLARFTDTIDFWSILKDLNTEIITGKESTKIWFKWYSWDDEQRTVQDFNENVGSFMCEVFDSKSNSTDGKNPLSKCVLIQEAIYLSPWVSGLCVLPPMLNGTNIVYNRDLTNCTYRCVDLIKNGTCYDWNATVPSNTLARQSCPDGYNGEATWYCLPNDQWETINPDLR